MSAFNTNFNNNDEKSVNNDNKSQLRQQLCNMNVDSEQKALSVMSSDQTNCSILNVQKTQKMPVSHLQELCAKKGVKTPDYQLIGEEGKAHSPVFTIRCVIEDVLTAEGMATTKKMAKHNAAEKALNQLLSKPEFQVIDCKENLVNNFDKLKIIGSDNCDSNVGTSVQNESLLTKEMISCDVTNSGINTGVNPVSVLQEFCAKSGIPLPVYEQLDQSGPSHEPVFVFACKIKLEPDNICGKGSAKTKQVAKRLAAENALNLIQQKNIVAYIKPKKIKPKLNPIDANMDSQIDNQDILDFLEKMYNYQELDTLLEANDSIDSCMRLSLICEKMGCNVEYFNLTEDHSKSNCFKSLIQVKKMRHLSRTLPVFVSWANCSQSMESAMQKAAKKAIIMIKILKM